MRYLLLHLISLSFGSIHYCHNLHLHPLQNGDGSLMRRFGILFEQQLLRRLRFVLHQSNVLANRLVRPDVNVTRHASRVFLCAIADETASEFLWLCQAQVHCACSVLQSYSIRYCIVTVNNSSLRLLVIPLIKTQRGLQEPEQKHKEAMLKLLMAIVKRLNTKIVPKPLFFKPLGSTQMGIQGIVKSPQKVFLCNIEHNNIVLLLS